MSRVKASVWLAHPLAALILATVCLQEVVEFTTEPSYALGDLGNFLSVISGIAVAWLVAWKRPRNPLGWLLLADAGWSMIEALGQLLGNVLLPSAPGVAAWAYWVDGQWSWIPDTGLLFTQILLRFPDGRLPSPRWRWFSWFTIASLVIGCAVNTSNDPVAVAPGVPDPTHAIWTGTENTVLTIVATLCVFASFIGSIASLFVRYRRVRSVERAQLRWLFWAACVQVSALILAWWTPIGPIVRPFALVAYSLIPIAIAVAVLRYGLYGIDRIISRTVSYAIVTIVIVGVYIGIVLGIGALLPKANSVGVAIATLAAAAVFLPLLRVVQRLVDRRFNRIAYNAQKVVDAFGERLRSVADPHAAGADLVDAVDQTLQPSAVGIWTRVGAPGRPRATE
jgi:hypothetical protein